MGVRSDIGKLRHLSSSNNDKQRKIDRVPPSNEIA